MVETVARKLRQGCAISLNGLLWTSLIMPDHANMLHLNTTGDRCTWVGCSTELKVISQGNEDLAVNADLCGWMETYTKHQEDGMIGGGKNCRPQALSSSQQGNISCIPGHIVMYHFPGNRKIRRHNCKNVSGQLKVMILSGLLTGWHPIRLGRSLIHGPHYVINSGVCR